MARIDIACARIVAEPVISRALNVEPFIRYQIARAFVIVALNAIDDITRASTKNGTCGKSRFKIGQAWISFLTILKANYEIANG